MAIGTTTPIGQLPSHGRLIAIALVLGLPATILPPGAPFPFRESLRAMVLGVAPFRLVVQALSMQRLLDALGIVTRSPAAELYDLLVDRARAVAGALDAAEEPRAAGQLSASTHEHVTAEYEREQEDIDAAIREHVGEHPDLRREELLTGERQVRRREKSAIMDAVRSGARRRRRRAAPRRGRRQAPPGPHRREHDPRARGGLREFWRERAAAFGLEAVDLDEEAT